MTKDNMSAILKNVKTDVFDSHRISAEELAALLPRDRIKRVMCLNTVDSTNEYIRKLALEGADNGQIVIADKQTAGRGRRGRSFQSPGGKGLYMSALFKPNNFRETIPSITAWSAVAVSNAIETTWGVRPEIKWVNDLLLNRKKICGILTEMSLESRWGHIPYVIIGIGININDNSWSLSQELSKKASCLETETGKSLPRGLLAAEIIKELDIMTASWPHGINRYLEAYRSSCFMIGERVELIFQSEVKSGTVLAVNDDFSLSVRFDDGRISNISSGEVSVRGLYE